MSDDTEQPQGLALRCGRAGVVVEVLLDTLETGLRPGRAVTEVLATASIPDALTLLTEAHRGLLTVPAELRLEDGDDGWLHVVGCSDDGNHVVLVASPTSDGLPMVVDALGSLSPGVQDQLHRLSMRARPGVAGEDLLHAMSATNNELVSMHRELARTHAELDRLNRRKDEILAMVAHDLRNPLGAVAGFGAALERALDGSLDDTSRLMLSRIQALSSRMLELVDDLLDASVIQSDNLQLDIAPTDLRELLRDTVANHEHAAKAKGVDLRLDLDRAPSEAWVDESRLVQVVNNLLSNAIKFSPADAGSQVTLACTTPDPDHVTISVRDQGVGMSAEDRDGLFEQLSMHSTTGTADERGTGLGLTITRSIVEAHGGSIDVESEVDQGSTFTVTIPVRPSGPV